MRMVRAIALLGLMEACRHGEYRASFRRFQVQARREVCSDDGAAVLHVHLCVRLDDRVLERGSVRASTIPEAEYDSAGRVRRWSTD